MRTAAASVQPSGDTAHRPGVADHPDPRRPARADRRRRPEGVVGVAARERLRARADGVEDPRLRREAADRNLVLGPDAGDVDGVRERVRGARPHFTRVVLAVPSASARRRWSASGPGGTARAPARGASPAVTCSEASKLMSELVAPLWWISTASRFGAGHEQRRRDREAEEGGSRAAPRHRRRGQRRGADRARGHVAARHLDAVQVHDRAVVAQQRELELRDRRGVVHGEALAEVGGDEVARACRWARSGRSGPRVASSAVAVAELRGSLCPGGVVEAGGCARRRAGCCRRRDSASSRPPVTRKSPTDSATARGAHEPEPSDARRARPRAAAGASRLHRRSRRRERRRAAAMPSRARAASVSAAGVARRAGGRASSDASAAAYSAAACCERPACSRISARCTRQLSRRRAGADSTLEPRERGVGAARAQLERDALLHERRNRPQLRVGLVERAQRLGEGSRRRRRRARARARDGYRGPARGASSITRA